VAQQACVAQHTLNIAGYKLQKDAEHPSRQVRCLEQAEIRLQAAIRENDTNVCLPAFANYKKLSKVCAKNKPFANIINANTYGDYGTQQYSWKSLDTPPY
jgi:hypothetical protein